ncbi:MAG: hypothetical protein Q9194_002391 [Teloschistes cf. exilis]
MDGPGPDAPKRPRLGPYDAPHSHRMQPQLPITQSHGYAVPHTLPPPNPSPASAPYGHQQSTVPPPYNDHEFRNLPEPTPHQYVQAAHSGHSTPRDQRSYPSEPPSYSRRGSASGPTRSPDDYGYPPARPLSIATSNEGQPYHPQHYSVEHGSAHSYHSMHEGPINGNTNHGPSLPTYNDQAHLPPSAHPHDYNPSPVSAHPHSYGPSSLSAQASFQNMQRDKVRGKGHRAQQRLFPLAAQKKLNRGRADRANQQILDKLADLSQIMQATNKRLDGMERAMADTNRRSSPDTTDTKLIPSYTTKQESPIIRLADQSTHPFVKPAIPKHKELEQSATSPNASSVTTASTDGAVPGAVVSDDGRQVAISIEHATAAHRLLSWPSIKQIVHKSKFISQISLGPDYVMSMEQDKGVLRLYGRGQGRDPTSDSYGSPPGVNAPGENSPGSSTSTRSDDASSTASSPPEGLWGSGSVLATNNERQGLSTVGGLTSENLLDIHPRTMRRLLNSYLENFHILHPFLERSRLTRMFERFSMRYNPSYQTLTKQLFSGPVSNLALDALRDGAASGARTAKRKHSSGHYNALGDPNHVSPQNDSEIRLEHSISTAIILLVMALGRIAEWKDPLPGPVYVAGDHPEATAASRPLFSPPRLHGDRSPSAGTETSPKSSNYAGTNPSISSLLSGDRADMSSPRLSADDASRPRNVDVIPGLAYYAKATDILGNLFGLNDLTQVQAHLLAGLFAGQLARTFESWSWIHSADILAELDLPKSGIQDIQLEYPKGFMDDFEKADMPDSTVPPNQTMMCYYSGQIHIRNMLNNIQCELYPPEGHDTDKERAVRGTALRDHFDARLRAWRDILPAELQWHDNDEPSSDINTARLRAKYYGAQYIIHRPFLRHALDNNMAFQEYTSPHVHARGGHQDPSAAFSPQPLERRPSGTGPPGPTQKEKIHQEEIMQSAQICVKAAIQSTIAFDNIISRQRLIVTNIFGTAHAQFGNMLVLATTYKSQLSNLISKKQLEHLFFRTIRFLRSLGPVSATLAKDALILEKLQEVVFDEGNLRHSFSSDMS